MSYVCFRCKKSFSGFGVRSIFSGEILCPTCDKGERAFNRVRMR